MIIFKEFWKMLTTDSDVYEQEQNAKFQAELDELNNLAKETGNTPEIETE